MEKSVTTLLEKLPAQRPIAYYSNTVQDGLYFNAQFVATPHVLVKFGHQDTAIFVMDLSKKDTLFSPHRLPYHIVDSIQFGNIKSYLLVRKP
jgi:Holliday junction resolvase